MAESPKRGMLESPFQQMCPEAVLGTAGPSLSLKALTAPLWPRSTQQEGPGDLTPLTRGECPAKETGGSIGCLGHSCGEGQGRLQSGGDYVAESLGGTTKAWANDSMSQSSVFSSIIFQGNYIIDKGVVLLYRSPLNKRRENNRI